MDHTALFHFFGRLQGLLVRPHREGRVPYLFMEQPAVKDAVEALGIPHTEVKLLVANDKSVSFAYPLQHSDRIEVYPHGWPVDISPRIPLAPPLPTTRRFILDVHLGKLARRLRMLGFDCLYRNDYEDADIVETACREDRIVLTRDRGLLKRKQVVWGCLLDGDRYPEQLRELEERYGLLAEVDPLGRCPNCNGLLQSVEKTQILGRLEPKTVRYYDDFRICEACDQIYWRGSHAEKIEGWVKQIVPLKVFENSSKASTKT